MAIGLGAKAAKSNLRKMIIKDAINYVPTAYKKVINKKKKPKRPEPCLIQVLENIL